MKPTVFRGIRSFFLLYPLLISPTAEGIKACYGSDSIQYPEDAPCFPDSEVSFCCKVGWACIQGNMCIDPSAPDLVVRRASCTDPTFKSSSCPNFCSSMPLIPFLTLQYQAPLANGHNSIFQYRLTRSLQLHSSWNFSLRYHG